MSASRPSIFSENIDLTGLRRRPARSRAACRPETSRRIAEEGGFPSRAPAPVRQASPKTGRTVLLNARITQRARDRFHEIVAAEQSRYAYSGRSRPPIPE